MQLNTLLAGIADAQAELEITGISLDSRTVESGYAFIALAGSKQHGLSHAVQAVKNGAAVILFEPTDETNQFLAQLSATPLIAIKNLADNLGEMAARFYGQPSQHLAVIGITGTNGKTSCSQFLAQALEQCGIIGTLGWGQWGQLHKTLNTTPDAIAVQSMLATLKAAGNRTVAMEVSSHGLAQGRVNAVHFKGAVFTNISRDHLDYHGTMDAYLEAKLTLLSKPGLAFVVVNVDDAYCEQIIAAVPSSVVVWGISSKGSRFHKGELVSATDIVQNAEGIAMIVHWHDQQQLIRVPLFGDFNIENVLMVLAVLLATGQSLSIAAAKLAGIKPVIGRMERFGGETAPLVFVDYAHTPDALDKVLGSVRKHCQQALWVVFGCGGNRDAGKRAQMGATAEHWADHVLVTDDNPRFEEAGDIVADILSGCQTNKIEVIQDRAKAIQQAITRATPQDCIIIAGKGHEQYQEIKGVQRPFSDSQCVTEALAMRTRNL